MAGSLSQGIQLLPEGESTTQVPAEFIGQVATFKDQSAIGTDNKMSLNSGRDRLARLVKNASGGTLAAKKLVKYGTSTGDPGANIGAYSGEGDIANGCVDPKIPSSGVPNGSYFWMFFDGPCALINSSDGALAIGEVCVTDASGEVKKQVAAPADTTAAMVQVNSKVGQVETTTAASGNPTVNLKLSG